MDSPGDSSSRHTIHMSDPMIQLSRVPKEPNNMNWLWWLLGAFAIAVILWFFLFQPKPHTTRVQATNTCFSVSGKGDSYNVCISDEAVEHLAEVWR